MIHSYPTIYNLGHRAVVDLLKGPVIVEEKIDGSQISFRKDEHGDLEVRSKGAAVNVVAPEGMFKRAVEVLKELLPKIPYGVVFRGEYLNSPKHNVLCYSRVPINHIIIYDATSIGEESEFANPTRRLEMATALGLETVPVLFDGVVEDPNHLRLLLDKESVLGGQKIEGVVIKPKNYDLWDRDKKVLMGKFVSEHFRETHSGSYKTDKKASADIITVLGDKYQTQARWQKALIHLKEAGRIENSPRDIGHLMAEVPLDVQKDCEADIRDALWAWAWPQLRRKVTGGLPEWYKDLIMREQFNETTATTEPVAPVPVPIASPA